MAKQKLMRKYINNVIMGGFSRVLQTEESSRVRSQWELLGWNVSSLSKKYEVSQAVRSLFKLVHRKDPFIIDE